MSTGPWFVRRRVGVGWRPNTWQGWVITVAALAAVLSALITFRVRKSPAGIVAAAVIAAVYLLAVAMTARRSVTVARPGGGSPAPTPGAPAVTPPAGERAPAPASPPSAPPQAATPSVPGPRIEAATPSNPASRIDAVMPRPVPAGGTPAPPSAPPALVVERLTKRFGERVAFEDVSFTVGAGEVFGFLGPNGAGKTTTVRTLGTLIAPSAGSATVVGIPLSAHSGQEIRQRIAIMPEVPGLYLRLSVRENLEFFAGLFQVPHARTRVLDALESVNLGSRADDLCGSLSKGLRQRAALARALLTEPDLLFLDEPTSGLDPVATREVHDLIAGLRRRGATVFITTHRLDEAERLCDRVAILNTTMRMVGRPDELRARLFSRTLVVAVAAPLAAPDRLFAGLEGVEGWRADGDRRYVLTAADPRAVAPALTRALVAAGADVESIAEGRHSLEDVYLELIDDDVEARPR